jgi:uncharacterized protein YcbX
MTALSHAGSLASLHRYPVKSMMGESLNATKVGQRGLLYDRAYALADPVTGKIASAKNPAKWPSLFAFRATLAQSDGECPAVQITLPDGRVISSGDPKVDSMLTEAVGRPVKLLNAAPSGATLEEYWPNMEELPNRDVITSEAMPPGTFFDCASVHLLTTATLDALRSAYPGGRFEPRRFRPNLIVATPPGVAGFAENDWIGKTISIGSEVLLGITGPCPRCVMTTLSQDDLPRDPLVLKTAAVHNRAHVGVYASVMRGGMIRRGDPVEVH